MSNEAVPPRARTTRAVLATTLFVFAGYVGLARIVENLYPLSTFSMYAGEHMDTASRLLAREADGTVHELDRYASFRCDPPVDLSTEHVVCGDLGPYYTIPYVDRAIVQGMKQTDANSSAASVDITVVRRVYGFSRAAGAPATRDCELARCSAVRR